MRFSEEIQVHSQGEKSTELKNYMEALSKIQETERIVQLLDDETSLLKETLGEKESDLSEFETLETRNKEALALIKDLEAQVESLNHENVQLKEMVDERDMFQEKLTLVENENTELKKKVRDQGEVISGLRGGDGKSVKGQIQQAVDRKVKEMGKEFREKIEANITIMKQRIRVAEQLQTENKENFRRIKDKCELEHFDLGKKVQNYSRMIVTSKKEVTNLFNEANEALFGLESSFERFGEKEAEFLDRISRIGDEIIVMKDWIKEKKEEEENLTLMRKMERLEKRVNELEKSAEVKEEAIFELVEEKKEAIRQLSFCIEYHQNRCDELLKSISNTIKAE